MSDYEYSVAVPSMYAAPNDDPNITIRISAHGGGTVGEEYAGNGWSYSIEVNGSDLITGDDLRQAGAVVTARCAGRWQTSSPRRVRSLAGRGDRSDTRVSTSPGSVSFWPLNMSG